MVKKINFKKTFELKSEIVGKNVVYALWDFVHLSQNIDENPNPDPTFHEFFPGTFLFWI